MQAHSFGNWLKTRRKARDLTQAELADQAGCSAAAIRKFEAEERRPSAQIIERLAEIFEIPRSEQAAFLRFARGEMRSAPAETEEDFPWQVSATPARSNLPATVTSLIGREHETALTCQYLLSQNIRLVTLIGPPGIGKTRLSVEVARTVLHDFPDGVFFVSLAPLDDPSLMATTISQSLGYVETKSISIREGIGDKNLLLVLDNCEHLIEGVASLVSELLFHCSRLKILATSRESLRISGEWLYTIPSLHVPLEGASVDLNSASEFPALTLFTERACAIRSDFALDNSNLQAVASICAQLDGLPLAIELIAARIRLMTPQALLEQLNNQFVLYADGMRSTTTRQKTLNDAIAWSYNLLSEEEQRLFAYLSVFSGGFTLEAVENIFSEMFGGTSVSSLVTILLDKSLLQRLSNHEDQGEIRFHMLTTIRHFAHINLQRMGKEADGRNKHLAYFLGLAEQGAKEIRGPNQVEWLHRLTATRDNLRTALECALETRQTEAALQMTSHLSFFWFRRSDLSEGRQWLAQVMALPDALQYPKLYSYTLAQLALHTWLQIGSKQARPFIEQALSVASENGDTWNIAWALSILGLVLINEGDFIEAESTLEKSKALFREVHDEWGYTSSVLALALKAYIQGDQTTSLTLHEAALADFRQLGDKYLESIACRFIGMLQIKQGDLTRGIATLQEALILAQQIDSKYELYAILWDIAQGTQQAGHPAVAIQLYWSAKIMAESIGVWQVENNTEFQSNLAACHTALGESAFVEAVEQGRAMSVEQAIEFALDLSTSP
jgi:predicted ATPase/transcriptional regulator with XRE-family HTH domain